MMLHMVDFLIGFVSLAHQHDNIVFLCVRECPVDGLRTVNDDLHRRVGVLHALEDVIDDGLGLLGARIIAGDNAEIREVSRDAAHLRALGAVAVAAAAEQRNNTALGKAANGLEHVLHAVRRVRVIDEHGVVGVGRHDLHAALNAGGRRHGLCRLGERHTELEHDAERSQRIFDREVTRDRQLDIGLCAVVCRKEFYAVRVQLKIFRQQAGLALLTRECQARALGISQHLLSRAVIQIDNALVADSEQQRLGLPVCLHRLVEVEVILCQVGECTDRKTDAVYTVEHERMRGNLHDDMGAARIAHPREQCVQLVGFRRGAFGFDHLIADEVLIGADQADLVACILEHMLDEVGRGGLAVGAGNAQHHHAVRRMAEAVRRDLRQRDARVLHHDSRNALRRLLADDCRRALFHRLGDVLVAVGRVAADGNEQVAGLYRARVVTHFVNVHILCGGAALDRNAV